LAGWNATALTAFPVYELPSDPAPEVSAEQHDSGYVLRGTAEYLALAPLATVLIVPAQVQETGKAAFFMLSPQTPGVKVGAPVLSLGLRTCPVADVELEAVRVPAEALLCGDAAAAYPPLASRFRPAVAAMALGTLRASYRAARQYALERHQGGRMIIEHDLVRLMLANMAVIAETGTALVECMALAADQGRPGTLSESGLILLTEQASRAASDGVQALGGYGYMQDYGQEKRMRDAKQIESIFGAAPAKRLELADRILAG
jgi:alkylation response protein AidB-like acyl-CoA dehydrogenase